MTWKSVDPREGRTHAEQEKGREGLGSMDPPRKGKIRKRPTERYGIDVVMQVDEDKQRQTEVKTTIKKG